MDILMELFISVAGAPDLVEGLRQDTSLDERAACLSMICLSRLVWACRGVIATALQPDDAKGRLIVMKTHEWTRSDIRNPENGEDD